MKSACILFNAILLSESNVLLKRRRVFVNRYTHTFMFHEQVVGHVMQCFVVRLMILGVICYLKHQEMMRLMMVILIIMTLTKVMIILRKTMTTIIGTPICT